MTNHILYDLQQLGYLARSSQLLALGHSRTALTSATRAGQLLRPVRPWVATPLASREAVIAVLNRGRLTNATALGSYGIWAGLSRAIHVLVVPNSPGTAASCAVPLAQFTPAPYPATTVTRQWGRELLRGGALEQWRVSPADALLSFGRTEAPESFVAAIDSALNTRSISQKDVEAIFAQLPARLRQLIASVDGRAESGTESIARQHCVRLARLVEVQVRIGPHRVDLLLDGWLIVELDSERWHADRVAADHDRDAWLTRQGYIVLRLSYEAVMFDWASCEATVIELMRYPSRRAR